MPWLPAGASITGVDLGIGDELDAEETLAAAHRELARLGAADGCWVTTHVVAGPGGRHSAIAVMLPGVAQVEATRIVSSVVATVVASDGLYTHDPLVEHDPEAGAAAAVADLLGGRGRAVVFPGVEALVGELPVEEVVARSAIDAVVSLGGPVGPGTALVTRDFVRPRLQRGRWVLTVQPYAGGAVVPFEDPVPHRCGCDASEVSGSR